MNRLTTEEGVLETIFDLADVKPGENEKPVFTGHPLRGYPGTERTSDYRFVSRETCWDRQSPLSPLRRALVRSIFPISCSTPVLVDIPDPSVNRAARS